MAAMDEEKEGKQEEKAIVGSPYLKRVRSKARR